MHENKINNFLFLIYNIKTRDMETKMTPIEIAKYNVRYYEKKMLRTEYRLLKADFELVFIDDRLEKYRAELALELIRKKYDTYRKLYKINLEKLRKINEK